MNTSVNDALAAKWEQSGPHTGHRIGEELAAGVKDYAAQLAAEQGIELGESRSV